MKISSVRKCAIVILLQIYLQTLVVRSLNVVYILEKNKNIQSISEMHAHLTYNKIREAADYRLPIIQRMAY